MVSSRTEYSVRSILSVDVLSANVGENEVELSACTVRWQQKAGEDAGVLWLSVSGRARDCPYLLWKDFESRQVQVIFSGERKPSGRGAQSSQK